MILICLFFISWYRWWKWTWASTCWICWGRNADSSYLWWCFCLSTGWFDSGCMFLGYLIACISIFLPSCYYLAWLWFKVIKLQGIRAVTGPMGCLLIVKVWNDKQTDFFIFGIILWIYITILCPHSEILLRNCEHFRFAPEYELLWYKCS